jgi:hypothetical protein
LPTFTPLRRGKMIKFATELRDARLGRVNVTQATRGRREMQTN